MGFAKNSRLRLRISCPWCQSGARQRRGRVVETVSKDLSTYLPAKGYRGMLAGLGKKGAPATVAARVVEMVKRLRDEPVTD